MDKRNLKIELRAVNYSDRSTYHVLEWRISPEQDVRYYKEHKWLFGLIKFGTVVKANTKWHMPYVFRCGICSKYYAEDDDYNYSPIFIESKEKLRELSEKIKTYGELSEWINERVSNEIYKYRAERKQFLEEQSTWNP